MEALEQFVVSTYGGEKQHDSLNEIRWFFFSRYQRETEKLPPTFAAIKYKIFRSHFVALVLKRSHRPIQTLPNVENYGWENIDERLCPIMTDNLPAPLALLEMSSCNCKSGCSSKRCKCRKNGFTCTDMCKCVSCKNNDEDEDEDDEIMLDEEIILGKDNLR